VGEVTRDGISIPATMQVSFRRGKAFNATITYPSLDDAKTKAQGNINGSHIDIVEVEVVKGNVVVPFIYNGEYVDNSISGTDRDICFQRRRTVQAKGR
jgi:hypothetical protein